MGGSFPTQWQPWPSSVPRGQLAGFEPPSHEVFVVGDTQGDPGALLRSLVLSGGVAKTGPEDLDLELTARGAAGHFVMLGDLLGRGPSNVRTLRILRGLKDLGADMRLLAGNEELRFALAMWGLGQPDARYAHLMIRGGQQLLALLAEARDDPAIDTDTPITESEARAMMLVDDRWFEGAPDWMDGVVPATQHHREIARLREKAAEFSLALEEGRWTLTGAASAAMGLRAACLEGEFAWYFGSLSLLAQSGSTLFVHAGINDEVATWLAAEGLDRVNERFREGMSSAPLSTYHGALGSCVRTRYRISDARLGDDGLSRLESHGVRVLVHGHAAASDGAHQTGPRLGEHGRLLDVGCDVAINGYRRARQGRDATGAAAVLVRPDGLLCGLSTDLETARWVDLTAAG